MVWLLVLPPLTDSTLPVVPPTPANYVISYPVGVVQVVGGDQKTATVKGAVCTAERAAGRSKRIEDNYT